MARTIRDFKTFEEAARHEIQEASLRTPQERIILLHKLIAAWNKFPRLVNPPDNLPVLQRPKRDAS